MYDIKKYRNEFLPKKSVVFKSSGFDVSNSDFNPKVFEFQKDVTRYALRKGRAGVYLDTGLGKTICLSEWARMVNLETNKKILIASPLGVSKQTVKLARKVLGNEIVYSKNGKPRGNVTITNYENLKKFDPDDYIGFIADESSIFKGLTGKYKQLVFEMFRDTPFKSFYSATPSPNDSVEIINQCEGLSIMNERDIKSKFFVHDDNVYRLKGHSEHKFYKWLASWGMHISKPSDLGYSDDDFILPKLNVIPIWVKSEFKTEGQLFFSGLKGLKDRSAMRKAVFSIKCHAAADIVNSSNEQFIMWCGLNAEAALCDKLVSDSKEVAGRHSSEYKEQAFEDFVNKKYRVLITKGKIAGLGMNFQQSNNCVFVGMNDCYDEETEILTKRGWLSFGELNKDDYVSTINQKTFMMEWQQPEKIIWENYSGDMYHFVGQKSFDLLVTPNHKLFVNRCKIRFPNDKTNWQLKYASDLYDNFKRQEYRMISTSIGFNGLKPDVIEVPLSKKQRIDNRSRAIRNIHPIDFMKLAGWYLSEGYCRPIDSREAGRIQITQVDEMNRKEIINLYEKIGLNVNSNTKEITGYSKNLAKFLLDSFGSGSSEKYIADWVKNLHSDLLVILRDTMIKGDGCHKNGVCQSYRTNSKRLADDFQEICLKTNVRASLKKRSYRNELVGIHNFYEVVLSWVYKNPSIYERPKIIKYDGKIGCVTVPNRVIVVRRNGIPVVSGNSFEGFYQYIRRQYRFGQEKEVNAYIVLADTEKQIYDNVLQKQKKHNIMVERLMENIKEYSRYEIDNIYKETYKPTKKFKLPIFMNGRI